jgi:hypothetical protein
MVTDWLAEQRLEVELPRCRFHFGELDVDALSQEIASVLARGGNKRQEGNGHW